MKWFGVDGIPGRTRSLAWAENAWQAMTLVRWAMAITIVLALAAPVLHVTQRAHGAKTSTSLVVLGLASLTSLLLIYRVLIDLPSSSQVVDQKLGAFVGVACALGSRSAATSRCARIGRRGVRRRRTGFVVWTSARTGRDSDRGARRYTR